MNIIYDQKGFTLVELAVVMMIIGLLIGGVLKGSEMVENARHKRVISDIQSFTAANISFMDTYGNRPGDMPTATIRIPNCNGACINGNGNGMVGNMTEIWNNGGQNILNSENSQFWRHLVLADLISGVSATPAQVAWGESHPASPTVGGYSILQSRRVASPGGGEASPEGLNLRIHPSLTAANVESPGGGMTPIGDMPLSPNAAGYIDRKIDDGVPGSGYVRSYEAGNPGGASCEVEYSNSKARNCMMSFKAE